MQGFISDIFTGMGNAVNTVGEYTGVNHVRRALKERSDNQVKIVLITPKKYSEDPQPVAEGTMMGGFFCDDIEVPQAVAERVEGYRKGVSERDQKEKAEEKKKREAKEAKAKKDDKAEKKDDKKEDKKDEKSTTPSYDVNLAAAWPLFNTKFVDGEVVLEEDENKTVETPETPATAMAQAMDKANTSSQSQTAPAPAATTKKKEKAATAKPNFKVVDNEADKSIASELNRQAVEFFNQKFDSVQAEIVLGQETFSDEELVQLVDNEQLRNGLQPGEQAKMLDTTGRKVIFTATPQGIVVVYGNPPKDPTHLLCHAPKVYTDNGMIRLADEQGNITGLEVTRILGDIAGNMPNIGQAMMALAPQA